MTFALDDDSLYQIKISIGFWCKSNHISSSKRFRLFYIKKTYFFYFTPSFLQNIHISSSIRAHSGAK